MGLRDQHASVVRVERADAADAAQLLALGFVHDAFVTHLWPSRAVRLAALEAIQSAVLRRALPYGQVFASSDPAGLRSVAVWLPPGVRRPSVLALVAPVVRQLPRAPGIAGAVRPVVTAAGSVAGWQR